MDDQNQTNQPDPNTTKPLYDKSGLPVQPTQSVPSIPEPVVPPAPASPEPVQPEPLTQTTPAEPIVPATPPYGGPTFPVQPETSAPVEPPTASAPASSGDAEVQIGKYKVKVVRSICIGAASCVAVSPNVFELDSENKAVIKPGGTDTEEKILMAAQACPTKAIVIMDTQTGKQVWPA